MPTIDVFNLQNKKVGTVDLDERLFGVAVNKPLIHEAVVMQRASRRQGTAATKTRGLISGGGRKPWKQKGTGRARAGSSRSPLWRGGGTIFGPTPRSYAYAFPRKKYRAALRGVLTAKARDGEFRVVDRLEVGEAKTKQMAVIMKSLGLSGRTLIITDGVQEKVERSARNIPGVQLLSVPELNVYDLLCARTVLVSKDVLARMNEVWS